MADGGATWMKDPVTGKRYAVKGTEVMGNHPGVEAGKLVPGRDVAGLSDAAMAAGIQNAIAEVPGRAEHGNTRTNAFFLVNGKAVPWNEYRGDMVSPDAVNVHSHSSNQAAEFVQRNGRLEGFNPLNSGDVRALQYDILHERGRSMALIMADGRMEVLSAPARWEPAKRTAFLRLSQRNLDKELHAKYDDPEREAAFGRGIGTYAFDRSKVRTFAARYGLDYRTGLRWREHPKGWPTAKAPEERGE